MNGVLQVFVKRISDALSRQVTQGQFDADDPFWAHDGQRIYFISPAGEEMGLWSVGVAGGRPELVLENVKYGALSHDGSRLALLRGTGNSDLQWSSPPGAEPKKEMRPPFDRIRTAGGQLRFSQDGQLLVWVYSVRTDAGEASRQTSDFYLIPKDSGAPRKVLSVLGSSNILTPFDWMPDNRHVIVASADPGRGNRHLWMADTASDSARPITVTHTNETSPAVSPDGQRIAYDAEEVDFDLILIGEDGTRRTMLATARNELNPVWSPAGDLFAFVTDRSGSLEIWARSRDGQWERPIVTAADFGASRTETLGSLAFSPDGRTLAYQRGADASYEIWLSPAGGGTPVRLGTTMKGRIYQDSPAWSPDGEWLAFHEDRTAENGAGRSLVKRRIGTDETVVFGSGDPIGERTTGATAWSPDGQWIANQFQQGLVLVPAAGGKPKLIPTFNWMALAWAADSRRLFALGESETSGHFALAEIDVVTQRVKMLNPDLGPIPVANQPIRGFSYVKGQGFLTSLASARSDIWLFEGFPQPRGWLSGLLRRGR